MKVHEIMTREVEACRETATLTQAVRLMEDGRCGIIPVLDQAGCVRGVVTDRDVCLAVVHTSRRPINISVHEVMTTPVRACRPDDDVRSALSTMRWAKVRRLPVIDCDGQLLGILSMDDVIVRALAGDAPTSAEIVNALREIVKREELIAAPYV